MGTCNNKKIRNQQIIVFYLLVLFFCSYLSSNEKTNKKKGKSRLPSFRQRLFHSSCESLLYAATIYIYSFSFVSNIALIRSFRRYFYMEFFQPFSVLIAIFFSPPFISQAVIRFFSLGRLLSHRKHFLVCMLTFADEIHYQKRQRTRAREMPYFFVIASTWIVIDPELNLSYGLFQFGAECIQNRPKN